MNVIKRCCSFFFSRCLWFYILATVLLLSYAQKEASINTLINYLHRLRGAEFVVALLYSEKKLIPKEECYRTIKYYKELEELIGPRSYIYGNAGFCYYQVQDYNKALQSYDRATKLSPWIYTYYADKATIYLALGEHSEALFWFQKARGTIKESIQYYRYFFQQMMSDKDVLVEKEAEKLHQEVEKDLLLLDEQISSLSSLIQEERLSRGSGKPSSRKISHGINSRLNGNDLALHFDTFFARFLTDFEVTEKVKNISVE